LMWTCLGRLSRPSAVARSGGLYKPSSDGGAVAFEDPQNSGPRYDNVSVIYFPKIHPWRVLNAVDQLYITRSGLSQTLSRIAVGYQPT
jgi:hypothetical protein